MSSYCHVCIALKHGERQQAGYQTQCGIIPSIFRFRINRIKLIVMGLNPLRAKFSEGTKTYSNILCHFSTLTSHR